MTYFLFGAAIASAIILFWMSRKVGQVVERRAPDPVPPPKSVKDFLDEEVK